MSKDILERISEKLSQSGENLPKGKGRYCGKDAMGAIDAVRGDGLTIEIDQVKRIDGPLLHDNVALGGKVKARHHMVAEVKLKGDPTTYVIDIAKEKGKRVYEGEQDYFQNSGIEIDS